MTARNLTIIALVACLVGCQRKAPEQPAATPPPADPPSEPAHADVSAHKASTFESNGRVVAIGDVHGDLAAFRTALTLAGLIDADDNWIGADATLVQTGDVLDRGDDEQAIMDLQEKLTPQAAKAGGQILWLNGNHEVMNVAGDLRYVTPGGFVDFEDAPGIDKSAPRVQSVPPQARARWAAFMPGGPYAKILAERRIVVIVDDSVFAHGGVLPHHVEYGFDAINDHAAGWMRDERDAPAILQSDASPIWTRAYGGPDADCTQLEEVLTALGAKRLVIGHTVQKGGASSACNDRVWRIDVGMAAHYGGTPQALEITKQGARVLR